MRKVISIIVGIAFALLCLVWCSRRPSVTMVPPQATKTDTEQVAKVPPIVIAHATPPRLVQIVREPDTATRARQQKKTIVTGSRLILGKRPTYRVQKINPRGTAQAASYDLDTYCPDASCINEIITNDTGTVQIVYKTVEQIERERKKEHRRKFWGNVVTGLEVAAAVIITILVVK